VLFFFFFSVVVLVNVIYDGKDYHTYITFTQKNTFEEWKERERRNKGNYLVYYITFFLGRGDEAQED